MKICSTCKILKSFDSFYKDRSKSSGLQYTCKSCMSIYKRQYQLANPEKIKQNAKRYRLENVDKIKQYRTDNIENSKQYRLNNVDKIKQNAKRYRLENVDKAKQYRLDNVDKIKQNAKRYRLENVDKIKISNRQYSLNNVEKIQQYRSNHLDSKKISNRQYNLDNPETARNNNARRRAKKLSNGTFYIPKKELIKLYASPCFYCGSTENIEADHVVPISRGGQHSIGNLVPACRACNREKHDKLLIEWKRDILTNS